MVEMLPTVMDTDFQRLAVIDNYISFIWTTRYYEPGDFELCVNVSSCMRELLKENRYIVRGETDYLGGIDEIAVIERVRIERDLDNKDILIASGRFASSILGRRIIAEQTQVSGTVGACVDKLMRDNAIEPVLASRALPFVFADLTKTTLKMDAQYTGKNLLETISDICKTYGFGFDTYLNLHNVFVFRLFAGVDRSYGQNENTFVVFSDDYENLESSDYVEDYSDTVTDVLVAGEGEGTERKKVWANISINTGLARYELFQDARNASTNNGEISDSVYFGQLRAQGLESVTGYTKDFAGKVDFRDSGYGEILRIGDIVTIENRRWGISMNARLIEVIESMSESGEYSITPTFEQYEPATGTKAGS